MNGSCAITCICRPSPRSATTRPIRPSPKTPSTWPLSSVPRSFFFSHLPFFIDASAAGMLRASAIIIATASSAVVTAPASGVFITTMPRSVAASTSMLSIPIPARPITTRSFASSRLRAVARVADRTISAWWPGSVSRRPRIGILQHREPFRPEVVGHENAHSVHPSPPSPMMN